VADIWKESLNLEDIDVFSNFFKLGGHSIIAVKIVMKIRKKTGIRIPLSSVFQNQTIEEFAELLNIENKI
jgi:acyl carrier protein